MYVCVYTYLSLSHNGVPAGRGLTRALMLAMGWLTRGLSWLTSGLPWLTRGLPF